MRQQLRKALVAFSVAGVLVGGGAAIAHAATTTPSAKATTNHSPASQSHSTRNCPNM